MDAEWNAQGYAVIQSGQSQDCEPDLWGSRVHVLSMSKQPWSNNQILFNKIFFMVLKNI